MKQEPAPFEILLTRLAFLLYGRSVYGAFADRLSLKGSEQVLDFGCGMGTVAHYAAKKLTGGHLTCLDISNRWLSACRNTLRRFSNVTFLEAEAPDLSPEHFDLVYCHFVLHELSAEALTRVIPALVKSLKPGGVLVFREPLNEAEKLTVIKHLITQSGLTLKDSRVTDIPLMGNALESVYTSRKGGFFT